MLTNGQGKPLVTTGQVWLGDPSGLTNANQASVVGSALRLTRPCWIDFTRI